MFDRDSLRTVLFVEQPYPNHNGGDLAFGPDGMLYIGLGDGGAGGDPERRALNMAELLGKMLRIDPSTPSGDLGYTIPADNPFVGTEGARGEIWSIGLRNPWRYSFDPETGDLWIADVGQGNIEEINVAPATDGMDAGRGSNFGWSAYEGSQRFNDDVTAENHSGPIFEYDHSGGRCSISGGVRARGEGAGPLAGWYVYADYCTGEVMAISVSGEGAGVTVSPEAAVLANAGRVGVGRGVRPRRRRLRADVRRRRLPPRPGRRDPALCQHACPPRAYTLTQTVSRRAGTRRSGPRRRRRRA